MLKRTSRSFLSGLNFSKSIWATSGYEYRGPTRIIKIDQNTTLELVNKNFYDSNFSSVLVEVPDKYRENFHDIYQLSNLTSLLIFLGILYVLFIFFAFPSSLFRLK